MILTNLRDLRRYEKVNPNFKKAFDFLLNTDLASLSGGKIDVDGANVFVKLANSQLKTAENAKLEVHNKYLDIQIPISKPEVFGWINRGDLKFPVADFDEAKDVQFFTDTPTTLSTVVPGECIIFFPEDAHAPLIGEGEIQKIIVKVAI